MFLKLIDLQISTLSLLICTCLSLVTVIAEMWNHLEVCEITCQFPPTLHTKELFLVLLRHLLFLLCFVSFTLFVFRVWIKPVGFMVVIFLCCALLLQARDGGGFGDGVSPLLPHQPLCVVGICTSHSLTLSLSFMLDVFLAHSVESQSP